MVYLPDAGSQGQTQLVWGDDRGGITAILTTPRVYSDPRRLLRAGESRCTSEVYLIQERPEAARGDGLEDG